MQVIGTEVEECAGLCQNGGVCMNGECRCRKGSYGAYCQYKESDGSSVLVTLFQGAAFLLLGAIILALFYGAYMYLKRIVRLNWITLCRRPRRSA